MTSQNSIKTKKPYKVLLIRIFWFVLPMRIILGLFVFYQFLTFVSNAEASKGGTIIEGVFEPLSYLPYRSNTSDDRFYQRLLFNSCITATYTGNELSYTGELCDVTTADEQVYTISIHTGFVRSDNKVVSADDVFFTYNKVLKNNIRQLPTLDIYGTIDVTQPTHDTIKVIFPFASHDNILFFTNFIVPAHILEDTTLEEYTNTFAANPVTSSCSSIEHLGQTDTTSLVFNLNKCGESHISYYQIKSFDGFSGFTNYLETSEENMVDMYVHEKQLPGYNKYHTRTNMYASIFFNQNSTRLSKRINRTLAGYIHNTFFSGDYTIQDYIDKDTILFDTFLSKGENMEEYIRTYNPRLEIDKKDLEMIQIQQLPDTITFTKEQEKLVYYIDRLDAARTVSIQFNIQDTTVGQPFIQQVPSTKKNTLTYKKEQTYTYTFVTGTVITGSTTEKKNPDGLQEGLNKFTIHGNITDPKTKKTTTKELGTIDIYYLQLPNVQKGTTIDDDKKIKIIYLKDTTNTYIAQRLEQIFTEGNVAQYMTFIGYDRIDEFETKITSKDYDIAIRPLNVGFKKDIGNIFLTDTPGVNPSMYTNGQFATYINEYRNETNPEKQKRIRDNINEIYGNDMPFMILGAIVQSIYIKENIRFLDTDLETKNLYDINGFKQEIFKNVQLVQHIRPNIKKIFSFGDRKAFFKKYIYGEEA